MFHETETHACIHSLKLLKTGRRILFSIKSLQISEYTRSSQPRVLETLQDLMITYDMRYWKCVGGVGKYLRLGCLVILFAPVQYPIQELVEYYQREFLVNFPLCHVKATIVARHIMFTTKYDKSPAIRLLIQRLFFQSIIKECINAAYYRPFVTPHLLVWWPVDSHRKGPVMRKAFLCHGAIMAARYLCFHGVR